MVSFGIASVNVLTGQISLKLRLNESGHNQRINSPNAMVTPITTLEMTKNLKR
jgi:hypothetical protein